MLRRAWFSSSSRKIRLVRNSMICHSLQCMARSGAPESSQTRTRQLEYATSVAVASFDWKEKRLDLQAGFPGRLIFEVDRTAL